MKFSKYVGGKMIIRGYIFYIAIITLIISFTIGCASQGPTPGIMKKRNVTSKVPEKNICFRLYKKD